MSNLGVNNLSIFSKRELKLLNSFLPLIERLRTGENNPSNPRQLSLLQVADGLKEPSTELEKAWVKLQRRKAFEADGTPIAIILRNPFNPYTPSNRDAELADY